MLRQPFVASTVALFGLLAAGSVARADTSPLGVAGTFGEFVVGDAKRSGSIVGNIAVGGSAALSNINVATGKDLPGENPLVVGGNLTFSDGSLGQGTSLVGGSAVVSRVDLNGGRIVENAKMPFNFSVEAAYLRDLSKTQYSPTDSVVTPVYGTLTFKGGSDSSRTTFLNVSEADFRNANSYVVNAGESQTVVVNVAGKATDFNNAGVKLTGGIKADHVLWNFYEATSLQISGIGIQGTVLAPWAAVQFDNGQISGGLIAASLIGAGTTDSGYGDKLNLFSGTLRALTPSPVTPPAVPEPRSLALLGIGLATAAALCRRNRLARQA